MRLGGKWLLHSLGEAVIQKIFFPLFDRTDVYAANGTNEVNARIIWTNAAPSQIAIQDGIEKFSSVDHISRTVNNDANIITNSGLNFDAHGISSLSSELPESNDC